MIKIIRSCGGLEALCRKTPKRNPDKKALQGQLKREQTLNRFSMDRSEIKEAHPWITDKRLRAMTKFLEEAMNRNRLTVKLDKASAKRYVERMKELEGRLYWEKARYVAEAEAMRRHQEEFLGGELERLPGYLKREYSVLSAEEIETVYPFTWPEELHPENIYWDQYMRLNSEEEARLISLRIRVRKLAENKLMEDE
jgi:hypothetical protein